LTTSMVTSDTLFRSGTTRPIASDDISQQLAATCVHRRPAGWMSCPKQTEPAWMSAIRSEFAFPRTNATIEIRGLPTSGAAESPPRLCPRMLFA
jgi:hypothetical protein